MILRCRGKAEISLSEPVLQAVEAIKEYMFRNVYFNADAKLEEPKAQNVIKRLFRHYMEHPDELPAEFVRGLPSGSPPARCACDDIAGVIDGFAIKRLTVLFVDPV